ncbi:MAG TPA: creatininase family protein [Candidatus Polarisedimenticolaceae bacterium]|nr:creatininase family protein [Candidatus Polarisedimenticolaceae bacterium]
MKPTLRVLQVLDRLEVGPARLAARRLTVPYRVVRRGRAATIDLVYRYGEDVFRPEEPASRNLGAMIGAQLALNYGLVCRELVLLGPFDAADRSFLQEMARNTAREIYVNKFLEPNPFLRGAAAGLAPQRRESYMQARLVFPDARGAHSAGRGHDWLVEHSRHAVLSSGGKDSLLSFGLLRELGREVHPIFLNEAGRHWYTALNAYRHLEHETPQTTRVWTNSDRVFSWMLRHFPFIRPDFAAVRADDYPIRLWTVAVFLFGALPLMRQRGIGRLVIGDEYDTSRRLTHKGIPHYDGLYDQSRWFDAALTRYYRRKGWGISQFSVLRPLSELLIQKILLQRYPQLLAHQVSCHAAHLDDGRARPCGRCEKCRRIVGLLVALGGDPTACGYTPEQVEPCLRALAEQGVRTEAEAVQHLLWLLSSAGRIAASAGRAAPQPRPEVLKLRFDPDRSPRDAIPQDLRKPLYRLCLEHADGAVRRQGRVWVPLDLERDPGLARPYPFEAAETAAVVRSLVRDPQRSASDTVLGQLTWVRARDRLRQTDLALLPVGSIEQHGPHLPLDTDAWDADYLARQVASACSDPKPLVLPLIPYGVSYHHEDFSGTLSVSPETLSRLVYEVGMSVARHGVTKLVVINGHGGNGPTLQFAAQMINRDAHIFACVDTGETSDSDVARLTSTPNDTHAGEVETSTCLATRPELVDMRRAKRFVPHFSSDYLNFSSDRGVEWYARTAKISPSGVLGDPTRASAEKGQRIWKLMIDHLVSFVESLKKMSLDEIYERRL